MHLKSNSLQEFEKIFVISTIGQDFPAYGRFFMLLIVASLYLLNLLMGSRFDFDCYGRAPRSSPRQANQILTTNIVIMKGTSSVNLGINSNKHIIIWSI